MKGLYIYIYILISFIFISNNEACAKLLKNKYCTEKKARIFKTIDGGAGYAYDIYTHEIMFIIVDDEKNPLKPTNGDGGKIVPYGGRCLVYLGEKEYDKNFNVIKFYEMGQRFISEDVMEYYDGMAKHNNYKPY